MASEVKLSSNVCADCPLVAAVNVQWAEVELFSATTEFSDYSEHQLVTEGGLPVDKVEKIMRGTAESMRHAAEQNMEAIKQLSEFVTSHTCTGPVDSDFLGRFCGVEGKLREQGVIVPEY